MAVKPLVITVKDEKGESKTYTLEFNRETVSFAENRGFKLADVGDYPMTKIPELFWYAFRMHHPSMSKANTDKIIFDEEYGFGGLVRIPEGVLERLAQLYDAPYGDIASAKKPKNSSVTVEL